MSQAGEAEEHEDTLRSRGLKALRSGDQPKRGRSLLFASVVPALRHNPISWEVFGVLNMRRTIDHYVAIRTLWDRVADRDMMTSLTASPTIHRRSVQPPLSAVEPVFAAFAKTRIPVLPGDHPHGLDGTRYVLQLGDAFAMATFEWWQGGPPAWEELVQTFHQAWESLESWMSDDLGNCVNRLRHP